MEDIMIDAKNDFNSWLPWTWSMKESLQHIHTLNQREEEKSRDFAYVRIKVS